MRIRMFPSIKEENRVGDFLLGIIKQYIHDVALSDYISELVVAEDDQYGNAIAEIDPDATYTENSDYVGFGKTIYNQGVGKSTIVIRNNLVIPVFENFVKSDQLDDWDEAGLLSISTIIHEVGHAFDFRTREYRETSLLLTMPFKLSKVVSVYLEVILDEIAANTFLKKYINDKYKLSLKSSLISELSKLERDLLQKRVAYTFMDSDKDYYELAQGALYPMRMIQEYMTLYDNVNDCLTSEEQDRFPYASNYFDIVRTISNSYPNWDKDKYFDILNRIVQSILSHFSIKHEETQQRDRLIYIDPAGPTGS